MKNILMQIFVLLPLSVIESFAGVMIIIAFALFSEFEQDGFSIVPFVLIIIGVIILVAMFFIERKIRDFDEFGVTVLFAITMPVRLVFQLITIVFAIISPFSDSIDSDYECLCVSVGEYISYVFLGCTFDRVPAKKPATSSSSSTSSALPDKESTGTTGSSSTASTASAKGKSSTGGGKKDLRTRNVCMQLFSLLPVAAGQFVLSYLSFPILGNLNDIVDVLWLFLIFIGLLILSMISTRLRGHEPTGEYFDDRFVYEKKALDDTYHSSEEIDEIIETTYRNDPHAAAPSVSGYKHKSGGWTSYLRPMTVLCFLSSVFLVFTQVISILIALFVKPYKSRVFPWYGAVDYSYCNHPFLQKLMHFYLGFIIFDY